MGIFGGKDGAYLAPFGIIITIDYPSKNLKKCSILQALIEKKNQKPGTSIFLYQNQVTISTYILYVLEKVPQIYKIIMPKN